MDNPALLQKGDPSRAPLFLIHGAGGAVYQYEKLDQLDRTVYTIRNPWSHNETKWDGGVDLMVQEYVKLIKKVIPKGDILVGGWSLGGQLAIDIGRTLALTARSRLQVVGIVMIDTLYPYWGPSQTTHAELSVDVVLANCPTDMREPVLRCMAWSKIDSPEWVHRNRKDCDEELDGIEAEEPPPAVLIYANEHVPTKDGNVAMADYSRRSKGGWDLFPYNFISAVWSVPAHHFALFDQHIVKETSSKVKSACDWLAED